MKTPARILVADNSRLLRFGLKTVLSLHPQFQLLEASTAAEVLARCGQEPPDLLLTSLALPGLGGIELVRRCLEQTPSLRVVIMCGYGQREQFPGLLEAGARGCVLRDRLEKELLTAVEAVLDGEIYVSRDLAGRPGAAQTAPQD